MIPATRFLENRMTDRRTGLRLLALVFAFAFSPTLGAVEAALPGEARVSIQKSASPSPAIAGSDLTYTITVSNEGPSDALNVVVNDTLPAATTFVSIAPAAGWSCTTPAAGATGTISCTAASLAPESAVFTIVVHVDPSLAAGSVLTNAADVSSSSPDARTSDNVTSIMTPVQAIADVAVTKSAPATASAGANVTYTIGWSSSGPSTTDVTITDTLPAGATFSSINAPGLQCTPGNPIVCSASGVAAGQSGTITIVVATDPAATTGTQLTNSVSISGSATDNNTANDSANATTTLTSSSDLALTKSGGAALAGGTTSWSIGYSAGGPSTATNVTLTDTLPAGTTATAVTASGWSCSLGPTVTCTIASLPAGASGTIVIDANVDPAAAGTLQNSATIASSGTADPAPMNDTATSSTSVTTNADLGVTITDSPDPVFPGSTLTYTVVVTKSGPSVATNATLTIALGAQTTFVSISPNAGWNCSGSATIVCVHPALTAASTTFTVVTTTASSFASATIVTTAQVASSATDPNPANNNASATTAAQSFTVVTATKSVSGNTLPNGDVTYQIVVHNAGPLAQGDNPGDELVDVLPSSLTLVSATATSGIATADLGTNTVHWNGALAAGGSVTITIAAHIPNDGALTGTTVTNQATVHFDRDGDGTNESTAPSTPAVFVVGIPAVPALSEWMLGVMAVLLAVVACRVPPR